MGGILGMNLINEIFIEVIKEGGLELIKKSILEFKSNKYMQNMLIQEGQNIQSQEAMNDNDISIVFSEENMKRLSNKISNISGYDVYDAVIDEVYSCFRQLELPHEIAMFYSKQFCYIVLEHIKEFEPEKYDRHFKQEWRKEQQEYSIEIIEKINNIDRNLELYRKNEIKIQSADELDIDMLDNTGSKFGLEFFTIDDNEFKNRFTEMLEEEKIYIKARCREEAIYCIVNELWRQNQKRPIYVVRNKEGWDSLRNLNLSGNIFIPWFEKDEIVAIPNNTNIFIYSLETHLIGKGPLELRPRKRRTIRESLEKSGYSYDEAYRLIEDTNGLFAPLKRKLFNGAKTDEPKWVREIDRRILIACLLVGAWKDYEGDKAVLENLSQMKYEDVMATLEKYSDDEEPFVYFLQNRGRKIYCLGSVENAWEYIGVASDDYIWKTFEECFIEVLNENENLFTYNMQEKIIAQFEGEGLFFSENLREGLLQTLLLKTCYKEDSNNQIYADRLITRLLSYIDSPQKWEYISRYFNTLCEIAPNVIIDRIEKEINNNTGLLDLFATQSEDFLMERNAYIDILFGLENLVVQRKYALKALECLLKIDNFSYRYVSNKPEDIIRKCLCIWYNTTAFVTSEEKEIIAKKSLELDVNAWTYLKDEIAFSGGRSITTTTSGPKYREAVEHTSVSISDYYKIKEIYANILLKHMDFDVNKWKALLKVSNNQTPEWRRKSFEIMQNEILQMSDDEIITIKNEIRKIIYEHRYYQSADWAMTEEEVCEYEKILDEIKVTNKELEYQYLFMGNWECLLLNPIPYEKDQMGNRDINLERFRQEIKEKIGEFKNYNLDLGVLAKSCVKLKTCSLGKCLGEYWSEGKYNEDVLLCLLESDESFRIPLEYIRYIDDLNENFERIIDLFYQYNSDQKTIVELYVIQTYKTKERPFIFQADKNIKELYWSENRGGLLREYISESISECKKYGNATSLIKTIYIYFCLYEEFNLSVEEMYKCLLGIENLLSNDIYRGDRYTLEEVFGKLQDEYINDEEKCEQIALWEFLCFYSLDWESMKCLKRQMEKNPKIYSDILNIVFKHDDGKDNFSDSEKEKNRRNNLYRLFDMAKFCPGESNGSVDEIQLTNWLVEFEKQLKANKQEGIRGYILGRLFAFSPAENGMFPCVAIRNAIERISKETDDIFIREFIVTERNKRGVFSPSGGVQERIIADKYKKIAEESRFTWPTVSEIFDNLYDSYIADSNMEREAEENGLW